ncbi:hypothetical protein WICMUC_003634 [Wickerhamomyces mucosus]|uniref:Uncharacterized protein n=1 Tax=Wickerhamomyces mucosus TaxID=1378264 RepID=A0A9P8PJP7_9ASCO|nr:hypothetical protein WICMUC_003634 [Wickerhamomyces mucosus]
MTFNNNDPISIIDRTFDLSLEESSDSTQLMDEIPPSDTANILIESKQRLDLEERRLVPNIRDEEMISHLNKTIKLLSDVSDDEIRSYKLEEEQDPMELMKIIQKLSINVQSKVKLLQENYKRIQIDNVELNKIYSQNKLQSEATTKKLQKEIKEYKRFIKELMERE